MTTIITHLIAIIVGIAGGWVLKTKFGAKAAAVVTAVESPPKPNA